MFTSAQQWASSSTKMLSVKATCNQFKTYYVAACKLPNITEKKIKDYDSVHSNLSWKSFDTYVKSTISVWKVNICPTDIWKSNCTCPVYATDYACKQSMRIAIRLQHLDVPSTAKTIPIGQKRKRGRPAKVGPALSYV